MHPDDEHFFVVRAVEDADLAAGGEPLLVAPEVVMPELLARGHLEAADVHSLRVDAAHDVTDRAVLAGGIEPLQAQEQAVGVLGGQAVLVGRQELHALGEQLHALLLLHEVRRVAGVEVLRQRHRGAGLHPQGADEFTDPRRRRLALAHVAAPPRDAAGGLRPEPLGPKVQVRPASRAQNRPLGPSAALPWPKRPERLPGQKN